MSYQVLARKWRPQTFSGLVGQRHVLQALVNALDHQRLHHAYLFTGTRGVGKTTLARLFAKGLNCEEGITSTPCGQCNPCVEIAGNRFVDLIEVDAASRTKVEDTRDLLDNVPYAPAQGRFKVYLIDEVHMLSNHSFNALLKTLEEPPDHVKFLLATTDPQKLPVTVLSRCLQFNLKSMTPELVTGHLSTILDQEGVSYEPMALTHLGKAAQGSMRDALSLADQALAFGNGTLREGEVAGLLGTIDTGRIIALIRALAERDVGTLLDSVAELANYAPDWQHLMADMLDFFHHLTILQLSPDYEPPVFAEHLRTQAEMLSPEDVQLFYQLGLQAWKDLAFAPGPRQAFEMALLRMLAFVPGEIADSGSVVTPASAPESSAVAALENRPQQEKMNSATSAPTPRNLASGTESASTGDLSPGQVETAGGAAASEDDAPVTSDPGDAPTAEPDTDDEGGAVGATAPEANIPPPDGAGPVQPAQTYSPAIGRALDQARMAPETLPDVWVDLIPALELGGAMGNMVQHANVITVDDSGRLQVRIDAAYETLYQADFGSQLLVALQSLGINVHEVMCEFGDLSRETAHLRSKRERREAIVSARQSLEGEPVVRELINEFSATWVPGSIQRKEQPGE